MKPLTAVYVGLNLVGMALCELSYFHVGAVIHAEGRDYGEFSDGLAFAVVALPAFLVCVLISCLWLTKVGVDLAWKRGWGSMKAFFAVVGGWASVLVEFYFLSR